MVVVESYDRNLTRQMDGVYAGVDLTSHQHQLALELLDASLEECDLPILRDDDDLEAGIRLHTGLAQLSRSKASVVAEAFNPLPQSSIVIQVGLTHSSALRYCAEADRLPLYNQPFDRVLRSATSISGF